MIHIFKENCSSVWSAEYLAIGNQKHFKFLHYSHVACFKRFREHAINRKVYSDRKSVLVKEQASGPYKSIGSICYVPTN